MNIVILGCGRVGSTLAMMMDREGHKVSVVDQSSEAFRRLPDGFNGEVFVGNGVDEEVLARAGILKADVFIAVTNGDNRNIMASQVAREIFKVKKVVCRIYDPIREETYRGMGMETFCPTQSSAQMLFNTVFGKK